MVTRLISLPPFLGKSIQMLQSFSHERYLLYGNTEACNFHNGDGRKDIIFAMFYHRLPLPFCLLQHDLLFGKNRSPHHNTPIRCDTYAPRLPSLTPPSSPRSWGRIYCPKTSLCQVSRSCDNSDKPHTYAQLSCCRTSASPTAPLV